MTKIEYSYDGKGKYQSCEIQISCAPYNKEYCYNSYEANAYGQDLYESLLSMIEQLTDIRNSIDDALNDIKNKNVKIMNNGKEMDTEILTEYFTGDHIVKDVKSTLNLISEKYS